MCVPFSYTIPRREQPTINNANTYDLTRMAFSRAHTFLRQGRRLIKVNMPMHLNKRRVRTYSESRCIAWTPRDRYHNPILTLTLT